MWWVVWNLLWWFWYECVQQWMVCYWKICLYTSYRHFQCYELRQTHPNPLIPHKFDIKISRNQFRDRMLSASQGIQCKLAKIYQLERPCEFCLLGLTEDSLYNPECKTLDFSEAPWIFKLPIDFKWFLNSNKPVFRSKIGIPYTQKVFTEVANFKNYHISP